MDASPLAPAEFGSLLLLLLLLVTVYAGRVAPADDMGTNPRQRDTASIHGNASTLVRVSRLGSKRSSFPQCFRYPTPTAADVSSGCAPSSTKRASRSKGKCVVGTENTPKKDVRAPAWAPRWDCVVMRASMSGKRPPRAACSGLIKEGATGDSNTDPKHSNAFMATTLMLHELTKSRVPRSCSSIRPYRYSRRSPTIAESNESGQRQAVRRRHRCSRMTT
mmetsp:Transcript_37709/g.72281  ORF Transcript_37709/g.72281 Transcript_37709/m.72281 type:complete len:220 (+) Transcript_37709:908-1567(+)